MSIEIVNLLASIKVIRDARIEARNIDFAWNILFDAEKHLQKEIASIMAA